MNSLDLLTDEELVTLNEWWQSLSPRQQDTIFNGYSTKFGYHVVRLALECEQLLLTGDLDLECNSEVLKAIRRGEWTLDHLKDWFSKKELHLEDAYAKSVLPVAPDEDRIKKLLVECLEMHYGSLDDAVTMAKDEDAMAKEMLAVLGRYGY